MAHRSKSWRKTPQKQTGKLVAAVLLALVTLGAAVWGGYWWVTTPAPIARNKETLCPLNTPPKDIIVIVFDTTDGLPEPSRVQAIKLLTDLIEESPENALLEIRVIDPTQSAGRKILTLCNPGDGRGLSEINANPEMVRRYWRDKFREPMLRELQGSLKSSSAKSSPLLATFQGIALEHFTGASAAAARKRLIIVSDMIEFVPGEYTQYPPADLRYEHFKKLPYYRKVRTDLQGAEVEIMYVDRARKDLHTGRHIEFWLDWIADNNGRVGRRPPLKLQGAGTPKPQGVGK